MILVVGGTGMLGSRVVTILRGQGREVRVLSRGVTAAPAYDGVDRVTGDVRDPARLAEAMAGVKTVVSAFHGFTYSQRNALATIDRDGNRALVAAAELAGADVVLTSVGVAASDSPLELGRMKYAAERALLARPVRSTIVRPDAFAQLWIGLLAQTGAKSHRPLVFGAGDNPIGWVSVDDVAALVARAVTDDSLRGSILPISGPEALSMRELAKRVMDAQGWPGEPRSVPRPALRLMAATVGLVKPALGRQARSSLAMDVLPRVDDTPTRALLPDLPATPMSGLLSSVAA